MISESIKREHLPAALGCEAKELAATIKSAKANGTLIQRRITMPDGTKKCLSHNTIAA